MTTYQLEPHKYEYKYVLFGVGKSKIYKNILLTICIHSSFVKADLNKDIKVIVLHSNNKINSYGKISNKQSWSHCQLTSLKI